MIYHLLKYHDITKYHDMYNNGDYGASLHYMYIQSSYSNSGAVSRHSYVMPYTVNITCYTLLVYTKAIKFVFFIYENTCIYQYHDIEVKMISRSNITIMINIIILCSSKYTVATYRIAQNFDSGKVRQHLTNQACQKV